MATGSNIYGYKNARFPNGVATNEVDALDGFAEIDMDGDEINIVASTVLVNGAPIAGAGLVHNPMISNLNLGGFDVAGVGLSLIDINTKTQNLSSTPGITTLNGNVIIASSSSVPLKINNNAPVQQINSSESGSVTVLENSKIGGVLGVSNIGAIVAKAYNDTNTSITVGEAGWRSSQSHSLGASGTDYVILTTPENTATPTERLRIGSNGITTLSGVTNVGRLEVGVGGGAFIDGDYTNTGSVGFDQDVLFNPTSFPSFQGGNSGWGGDFVPKPAPFNGSIGTSVKPFSGLSIEGSSVLGGNSQMKIGASESFAVTDDTAGQFQLLKFSVNNAQVLSQIKHVFTAGLEPINNLTGDIGTTLKKFNTVYCADVNIGSTTLSAIDSVTSANTNGISGHSIEIDTNATAISDNFMTIETNTTAISDNTSSIVTNTNDLAINTNSIVALNTKTQYQSANSNETIFTGAIGSDEVKVGTDWTVGYDSRNLNLTNADGYKTIIGTTKPDAAYSTILSHIDNTLRVDGMLSGITDAGGVNRCWGHTETYIAGGTILAGRVLAIIQEGTFSGVRLRVGYLYSGIETSSRIYPIGISQHDALQYEPITICTRGITSVISSIGFATPQRGSVVVGGLTGDYGRILPGAAAGADQSRLGFMCQATPITANTACLIYFSGGFQT